MMSVRGVAKRAGSHGSSVIFAMFFFFSNCYEVKDGGHCDC